MKSQEYRHYILTRFNNAFVADERGELYHLYDRPGADEWMDERMEMFREKIMSAV